MVRLWTNFAKTSSPTPDQGIHAVMQVRLIFTILHLCMFTDDPLLGHLIWDPDKKEDRGYLRISDRMQMMNFTEDMTFR